MKTYIALLGLFCVTLFSFNSCTFKNESCKPQKVGVQGSELNGRVQVFPSNCWGVYSWAGWDPKKNNRDNSPLIKGAPLILHWKDVEPEPGQFKFEEVLTPKLVELKKNDYYTFIMIWVAPNSPRWLYNNGVPELKMTKTINPFRRPRNVTFPYYFDKDYISFYYRDDIEVKILPL